MQIFFIKQQTDFKDGIRNVKMQEKYKTNCQFQKK